MGFGHARAQSICDMPGSRVAELAGRIRLRTPRMACAGNEICRCVAGAADIGGRMCFPVGGIIACAKILTAGGMAGLAVPDILGIGEFPITYAAKPGGENWHRNGGVNLVNEGGEPSLASILE